ncbi:Ribonuclease HI [compost metagenome]
MSKAKKNGEENTENKPEAPKGMVIYSDGGCRPNPGNGGWGIHGYLFSEEPPKKGSGNTDHLLTTAGYLAKATALNIAGKYVEVTPIHYVDGTGSVGTNVSNNVAEVVAAAVALEHAANYDIVRVLVRSDSEYTCKGLEKWVHNWQRNGWLKSDGFPPANVEYWKRLVAAREVLQNRGVHVKIEWLRAHDGEPGNEAADKQATIGVFAARAGLIRSEITVNGPEGYWKYDTERNPMISLRRMYFNTQVQYNRPGEYYLGEHGKDDELLGKRISDGAFAVVQLAEPDPVLEMLRGHQIKIAGEQDSLVMALLDQVYKADRHRELLNHGPLATEHRDPYRLDLHTVDEEPLTRELRPPRIAMRAVEAVEELAILLKKYEAKDPTLGYTDLTSILYETSVKVDKKEVSTTTMKLKPEYTVGFARLEVNANYLTDDGVSSAPVILTLGIDMLDRNSLRRLEAALPKVTLITWNEAPTVFRYATVVEAGADKGIWAGVYSNLRIVT